jgi:acetyl-CoA C-acetyltransferase
VHTVSRFETFLLSSRKEFLPVPLHLIETTIKINMYRSIYRLTTSKKNFGKTTYIVAAKRTPIGSFLGKLSKLTAVELGGIAVKAAIESIKLDPKIINEVLLGNVVSAGLGQAPARQASMKGGIDKTVPCTTINKVCSSGMKTIMLGSQSIGLGLNDIVVAGGFESMSNAPFYVTNVRLC